MWSVAACCSVEYKAENRVHAMAIKEPVTKQAVVYKLPSVSPRVLIAIAKNLLLIETLSAPCTLQPTWHADD
jgi:hypothetical protein